MAGGVGGCRVAEHTIAQRRHTGGQGAHHAHKLQAAVGGAVVGEHVQGLGFTGGQGQAVIHGVHGVILAHRVRHTDTHRGRVQLTLPIADGIGEAVGATEGVGGVIHKVAIAIAAEAAVQRLAEADNAGAVQHAAVGVKVVGQQLGRRHGQVGVEVGGEGIIPRVQTVLHFLHVYGHLGGVCGAFAVGQGVGKGNRAVVVGRRGEEHAPARQLQHTLRGRESANGANAKAVALRVKVVAQQVGGNVGARAVFGQREGVVVGVHTVGCGANRHPHHAHILGAAGVFHFVFKFHNGRIAGTRRVGVGDGPIGVDGHTPAQRAVIQTGLLQNARHAEAVALGVAVVVQHGNAYVLPGNQVGGVVGGHHVVGGFYPHRKGGGVGGAARVGNFIHNGFGVAGGALIRIVGDSPRRRVKRRGAACWWGYDTRNGKRIALRVNVVGHHVKGFHGPGGDNLTTVVNGFQGVEGGFNLNRQRGGVAGAARVAYFIHQGGEVTGLAVHTLVTNGAIGINRGGPTVGPLQNTHAAGHQGIPFGVTVVGQNVHSNGAAGFGHSHRVIGGNYVVFVGAVGVNLHGHVGGRKPTLAVGHGVGITPGTGKASGGGEGDTAIRVQHGHAVGGTLNTHNPQRITIGVGVVGQQLVGGHLHGLALHARKHVIAGKGRQIGGRRRGRGQNFAAGGQFRGYGVGNGVGGAGQGVGVNHGAEDTFSAANARAQNGRGQQAAVVAAASGGARRRFNGIEVFIRCVQGRQQLLGGHAAAVGHHHGRGVLGGRGIIQQQNFRTTGQRNAQVARFVGQHGGVQVNAFQHNFRARAHQVGQHIFAFGGFYHHGVGFIGIGRRGSSGRSGHGFGGRTRQHIRGHTGAGHRRQACAGRYIHGGGGGGFCGHG